MTYRSLVGDRLPAALAGRPPDEVEWRCGVFLLLNVMFEWSAATAWALVLGESESLSALRGSMVPPETIARTITVRAMRVAQEVV